MRNPQILNLQTGQDSRIAIDGYNVINDTTQLLLSDSPWSAAPITVDMALLDLTSGVASTIIASLTMSYDTDSDFWYINLNQGTPNLSTTLVDRKKYVAKVYEHTGGLSNMRDFKIHEFTVDNDSLEDTIMRLPFRIEIGTPLGTPSYMVWYDTEWSTAIYRAKLYQGEGASVANAEDASRVTSRGAIEVI